MTTPAPDLLYVRRSTCHLHMPALNAQPMTADAIEKVLRAGQTDPCPDCGRIWTVVQEIVWGGPVTVKWQAMRPASVPDPVLARLDALEAAVSAQAARIAALEARTVTQHRALPSVAALLLNGKVDVTATWSTPFADANYTVEALPTGLLVGKIATPTVKSQTATGCVIGVTATAAVAAGSVLDVTATRYA